MEDATTRATLTVEEAGKVLGIGRASAYEGVRRGEIPAIRVGRRVVVPKAALDRLLALTTRRDPDQSDAA